MEENKDIGVDELLEWAKLNHMVMSESKAKEIVDVEKSVKSIDAFEEYVDLDEWYKENGYESPIGEYESLSKKMKKKINDIVKSMEETDDRNEKDTLDEKDGKEELDEDKKKEVEGREKENGEYDKEDKENGENGKENEVDIREDKNTEAKNEEELNKTEY